MKNIVFDTNAYRNLVAGKSEVQTREYFENLVKMEFSKGYCGLLSPIVLMELFSHLADENDKDYNTCKKAVIGAYIHCRESNGNFRMLVDFEVHLCILLFNKEDKDSIKEQLRFGKIAFGVYNDSDEFIAKNKSGFEDIKSFVENEELKFIENVNKEVIAPIRSSLSESKKTFEEEFDNFVSTGQLENIIALSQLIKTTNTLKIDLQLLSENERKQKINYILDHFQTPIKLYQNLVCNIVDSNGELKIEKKKRPNLIWDFQICFCVGRNEIGGIPVMLVSDDGAILEAAEEFLNEGNIMKFEDYLNLLNLDT